MNTISIIANQSTNLQSFGIAQIPRDLASATGGSLLSTAFAINPDVSENKLAVIKNFIGFLISDEILLEGMKNYAFLTGITSLYDHSDVLDNKLIQGFRYALGRAYQTPISKVWKEVKSEFGVQVNNFLKGKIPTEKDLLLRLENGLLQIVPEEFDFQVIQKVQVQQEFLINDSLSQANGFLLPMTLITFTIIILIKLGKQKRTVNKK
jgi:hypothetical protein